MFYHALLTFSINTYLFHKLFHYILMDMCIYSDPYSYHHSNMLLNK